MIFDKKPKRRKDKDNPYEIHTKDGRFFISFKDGCSKFHFIKISQALYETFNRFELEDLSHLNVVDRHYEKHSLSENEFDIKGIHKEEQLENIVWEKIRKDSLKKAIDQLSETQKRRIKLYYFSDLKIQEISELEGCNFQNVAKSIKAAKRIMKKILEQG